MKKAILRVLLVICGLNVFTACYGMPPGEWDEFTPPLPEEQEKAMAADSSDGDSNLEEAAEAGLE